MRYVLCDEARQVLEVFPDLPLDIVQADLQRTRSVELTIENLIEGNIQLPPVSKHIVHIPSERNQTGKIFRLFPTHCKFFCFICRWLGSLCSVFSCSRFLMDAARLRFALCSGRPCNSHPSERQRVVIILNRFVQRCVIAATL